MNAPLPRWSPPAWWTPPVRITLVYAAVGALWILFSDEAVQYLAPNLATATAVSILKGLFYVLFTAALLYTMIERHTAALLRSAQALGQSEELQRGLARTRQTLLNELDHRVKNNLASLYSLVCLYEQGAASVQEFADAMRGKLLAMRAVHEAIAAAGWQAVDLAALVETLCKLFAPPDRDAAACAWVGPALRIAPRQAAPLAMTLQELLTNSRKHGALSVPAGQVRLDWTITRRDPKWIDLELVWAETGGPPPHAPAHKGQGLTLIEGFAQFDLGGNCAFDFPPAGFRCVLRCRLEDTVGGGAAV
jgi:two-component sensor histidine kinase